MMQPNVGEIFRGNRRQRLGHTIDERLRPDETRAGMHSRLGDEMLTTAESDFEPHVIDWIGEQRSRRRRLRGEIEGEPRQQGLEQRRLPRP